MNCRRRLPHTAKSLASRSRFNDMEFLNALKLNTWWSVVLWLGLITLLTSSTYDIDFLENKHLFGLGISLILIGLSMTIAEGSFSYIKPSNAYTGGEALITKRTVEHNLITLFMLCVGTLLSLTFLSVIVISLI